MTSNHCIKFCLAALLLTTACTSSEPEKAPLPEIETKAPTRMSPDMEANLTQYPDRYKKRFIQSFEALQKNNEVRTEQIIALMDQQLAWERGQLIGSILTADENNDGDLDANELLSLAMNNRRHSSPYNRYKTLPLAQGDRNGDGVFSADEIRKFSNLFVDLEKWIGNEPTVLLMTFDANQNGVLTRAEFEQELSIIKSQSANLAPTFRPSSPERSERQESQQKLRDEMCKSKLEIPKNAKLLLLSGYEGNALSTVMVTTKDRDTEVTQVIIEEGDEPLYIIAGAYTPMIWSVEGDIDRVSGFIATKARGSSENGAGVMGLPANRVDFIADTCMGYFTKERSKEGILAKTLLERIYDRPIDTLVTGYTLDSVTLPSGEMLGKIRRQARESSEEETGAKRTEVAKGLSFSSVKNYEPARQTNLYRYFKDGIAYVDPKQVVSPTPLSTYEVHPGEAGLSQLLETGHLERLAGRDTFYIKKTFPHFPSGLAGAHQVSFILGKGVARPAGTPGHSSLIDEATGECLTSRCR